MKKVILTSTAMLFLAGCGVHGSNLNTSVNDNTIANKSNISTVNVRSDDVVSGVVENRGRTAENKEKISKLEVSDKKHYETENFISEHDRKQDRIINFNNSYIKKVSIEGDKKFIAKQFEKWEKSKSDLRKTDIARVNAWCSDPFMISLLKDECSKYNSSYRYQINKYLKIKN